MAILAWLGVPAAATVLAIAWVHWVSRPRRPMETQESLAQHDRFRAAMAKPPVTPRQRRSSRHTEPARSTRDAA